MFHFGFSYVGLIYLLMLFIPNIIWTKNKPKEYEKYAKQEKKVLQILEKIGEVLVSCFVLIFSDSNIRFTSVWSIWLLVSFMLMLLYEVYWIRYFRSEKNMSDFYRSICGIPVLEAFFIQNSFLRVLQLSILKCSEFYRVVADSGLHLFLPILMPSFRFSIIP